MLLEMMKGKIHRARVTEADLNYVGSITIDRTLMEAADILPNQKVQVVNNNNGSRFETYVIEGERDTGIICLNGAAARLAQVDDVIIIISYGLMEESEAKTHQPNVVFVNEKNQIERIGHEVLMDTIPAK